MINKSVLCAALCLLLACADRPATLAQGTGGTIPVLKPEVVRRLPHDRAAFTQGLVFEDGALYEGTGLYGASELRRVKLDTGAVERRRALPQDVFGEGLASLGGRLYQLTWKNKVGYVYDRATFELQRQFTYDTEGWGLTTDGRDLILSDGSNVLRFIDPTTFREVRRVSVTANGQAVRNLNELEFVEGAVYANVWLTDTIARIDPATGRVTAWVDLTDVSRTVPKSSTDDVLNGIAWDAKGRRLFVTGKRWPALFEIRLPGLR
ncbi:glutaminyl-peptide cyclotransferase [Deinococcus pimensis]|uniref:glutaminyl-peptide cyclotransferase n=1 Tax=Deinococcus pimensis TaxID=309888 RepID=UPI001FDF710B|nr:glutaminyl-peptide cyclotransferase [Deinococcus pimensis]